MKSNNFHPQESLHIQSGTPFLWLNHKYGHNSAAPNKPNTDELYAAEARLERFAPLLAKLFPELESSGGLIESSLIKASQLNTKINPTGGELFLKADHDLPVAGSIKARGGIHEVLCFAEELAFQQGLIQSTSSDYLIFTSKPAKALFSQYTISVGSTGNLGLSIGIIGSALGFNTVVHMSSDAKAWKKQRLKHCGVTVIEHSADYTTAVQAGRLEAEANPYGYFIDDERSPRLFMGYAVAALRLHTQLQAAQITVDAQHPLFVYLPAGVGGAPGGITFGLKILFGDHAHCFFAEPVQAPCMLLGMAGDAHSPPMSVYDAGLNIDTNADGLAVGAASQWVCDATRHLLSGVYTATDKQMLQQLYLLKNLENTKVELSAAIACLGPKMLNSTAGRRYLEERQLSQYIGNATHIAWLTGGSLMPDEEYQHYIGMAQLNVD